jgi:DNA-binding transcriptional ArsR family regulator
MSNYPDLAAVASLIADPARASMLSALLGNIALPAGELARLARITPQTASAHLAKLVEGNLLSVTALGRHRYFRLRDRSVAQALESLALLAAPARVTSLNDSLERKAIHRARTCYDHLAGALGVGLTQALMDSGFVEDHGDAYEVTRAGETWFHSFGIDCSELQQKRRAFARFARSCLDWSERKPHLAGALGAAVLRRLLDLKWLLRVRGSRAVKVTDLGRQQLQSEFGLDWK